MKILAVKIQKLLSPEFLGFLKQVFALLTKYDASKLKVTTANTNLSSDLTTLDAALAKETSNLLTKTLNDFDRQRDLLISNFIKWLECMQFYPDKIIAAHATEMLHFIETFGKNIANQTQLAETTILTNIVAGFRTDATRKANLAAMNGTLWIDSIDTANKNFIKTSADRVANNSDDSKLPSFSTARRTATANYNSLVSMIESRYHTAIEDKQPTLLHEQFITELNELIKQTNTSALLSQTHKPTTNTDGTTPK